jgi:hypothetical protein
MQNNLDNSGRTLEAEAREQVGKNGPVQSKDGEQSCSYSRNFIHHSLKVACNCFEVSTVCVWATFYNNINSRQYSQYFNPNDLPKLSFQCVPLNARLIVLWNDKPNSGMNKRGSENSNLEELGPKSLPLLCHTC